MTRRTTYRRATDRVEHADAAAKPICRRLFSIEQAPDLADVAVQVIHRWIRMGELELYDLGGGRLRIEEVELADLITSPNSDQQCHRDRPDGSGPGFAKPGTWRM